MKKREKEQQIFELIQQNTSVLICLPENPTTDAIASSLALLAAVEKLKKRAKIVSSGFQLPANHNFLPKSEEIFDDLTSLRKFIISLDISKTSIEELSYNIEGDTANIYISPKDGSFDKDDVSCSAGEYAFDLVITIDSQDLESLGKVYEQNTDFFYHTPIVNIDHVPDNEHYGQIDLVQVTATSTSEIVFELIKDWGKNIMDEYIATNLLTGMISKTKSFQSGSVTPRSLSIASHLISQGARREDIVKHLYQSKKVSTLKLWGRALSRLQSDSKHKIVWSRLQQSDFEKAGAEPDDLPDVIDELIINTPEARNVFMLYTTQDEATVHGIVSTAPYINARELFEELSPTGTEHFIRFTKKDSSTEKLQEILLNRLRKATLQ